MTHPSTLGYSVLAMALAAIYPLQANAAAGVAQFIAGDVNVRRTDGLAAPLAKGRDIESGDAILTGINGRAQVKFSDGGLISLQPNTEFKIANYSDNAANPKEERFLVNLLRGSMRAITGLIGKRNRDNYKVTTTTATIGIRGSGFNVGYNPDGSLGVTTELDAIEVCTTGGCVGLTAGESVRVVNATDAPVRTNVKAPIPTPEPERDPITVGDQTNTEGKAKIVTAQAAEKTTSNTGNFTDLKIAATYYLPSGGAPGSNIVGPAVANSADLSDGKLTAVTVAGKDFTPSTTTDVGSAGSIANSDFIGWGRWTTGTRNPSSTAVADLHYVIGQPTVVMPVSGTVNYSVIGQTTVTGYTSPSGPVTASGVLTSASLTANFSNPSVNVSINTTLGNLSVSNIAISGSQFTYAASNNYIDGIFVGPNASRAGVVYTGLNTVSNALFSGAVVFQAP